MRNASKPQSSITHPESRVFRENLIPGVAARGLDKSINYWGVQTRRCPCKNAMSLYALWKPITERHERVAVHAKIIFDHRYRVLTVLWKPFTERYKRVAVHAKMLFWPSSMTLSKRQWIAGRYNVHIAAACGNSDRGVARRRLKFLEILQFKHGEFTWFGHDLAPRTLILRLQTLKIFACGANFLIFFQKP